MSSENLSPADEDLGFHTGDLAKSELWNEQLLYATDDFTAVDAIGEIRPFDVLLVISTTPEDFALVLVNSQLGYVSLSGISHVF